MGGGVDGAAGHAVVVGEDGDEECEEVSERWDGLDGCSSADGIAGGGRCETGGEVGKGGQWRRCAPGAGMWTTTGGRCGAMQVRGGGV